MDLEQKHPNFQFIIQAILRTPKTNYEQDPIRDLWLDQRNRPHFNRIQNKYPLKDHTERFFKKAPGNIHGMLFLEQVAHMHEQMLISFAQCTLCMCLGFSGRTKWPLFRVLFLFSDLSLCHIDFCSIDPVCVNRNF